MKKLAIAIALVSIVGYAGIASAQQNSATASAVPATADIVAAIAIEKTANLNFGQVVASASLGTVVMSPAGTRTAAGGVTLANSTGSNAAAFTVSGEGSDSYAITLPTSTVTLTHTNTTDVMSVDTFTSNPDGTGTLSSGSQALTVGAKLHVAAAQLAGAYAGTFNVTVAYN